MSARRGLRSKRSELAAPAIVRASSIMPVRAIKGIHGCGVASYQEYVWNNKLIAYRKEITREYFRQNLFCPLSETPLSAIVRIVEDMQRAAAR